MSILFQVAQHQIPFELYQIWPKICWNFNHLLTWIHWILLSSVSIELLLYYFRIRLVSKGFFMDRATNSMDHYKCYATHKYNYLFENNWVNVNSPVNDVTQSSIWWTVMRILFIEQIQVRFINYEFQFGLSRGDLLGPNILLFSRLFSPYSAKACHICSLQPITQFWAVNSLQRIIINKNVSNVVELRFYFGL